MAQNVWPLTLYYRNTLENLVAVHGYSEQGGPATARRVEIYVSGDAPRIVVQASQPARPDLRQRLLRIQFPGYYGRIRICRAAGF